MKYYLIARSLCDNECQVISLKEDWYLKNGGSNLTRTNKLSNIDLVTMQFKSEEDMIKQMYKNHYIEYADVDLFIATKNKKFINTSEVIYNKNNSDRINDLREIAVNDSFDNINMSRDNIINIYNKLISKAHANNSYKEMILYTNIPKIIRDDVSNMKIEKEIPYNLKFKNSWAFNSYSFARNTVESLERYDMFYDSCKDDDMNEKNLTKKITDLNIEFLNKNRERKDCYESLLEMLDKDYIPGQYNLFGNRR